MSHALGHLAFIFAASDLFMDIKFNDMVYNDTMSFYDYLSANAEEISKIPENSLSCQEVTDAFHEDLFKGFITCLQWSGFHDIEHFSNNREEVVKLLEEAKECLRNEEIHKAISLRQSKVFGKTLDLSIWSRTLYFLSRLLECDDFRSPVIYDENLKDLHAAIILSNRDELIFYEKDQEGNLICLQSGDDEDDARYIDYCRRVIYACKARKISPNHLASMFSDCSMNCENSPSEVGKEYWRRRLAETEKEEEELLNNKDCKRIEWYCEIDENPYGFDDDDEDLSDDFYFSIHYKIDGYPACEEQYFFSLDTNNVRGIFFDRLELVDIINYDEVEREHPFNLDNVRLRRTREEELKQIPSGSKVWVNKGERYYELIDEDTGKAVIVDVSDIEPERIRTHHYGYLVGSDDETYDNDASIGEEHDDFFRKCLAYLLTYGEFINVFHKELPNPLL